LGRISRQQDFIRRTMQRALDKGSGSPRVANDLLNAGLKNVITDEDLTPIRMLQLAQAMRGLNTSGIPSYTIEASGQMIGDQAVLVPRLQNDTMREVLALFQGKASFGTPQQASDEGAAPRVNASRPPGVWQSFEITFRAPRFDSGGNKIQNAAFLKVVHNGETIHENVELSGPTRGGRGDESERGPFRLQGDHGPVAFRNLSVVPLDSPK
ncbi:MAG: DUF1080 domain-containing protein, partial [Proteobacteria bacterium]|nr:DUF1080 domain-containing protein [Pseudomonadota bacterium]